MAEITFEDLPFEAIHYICGFLDIQSLDALRKLGDFYAEAADDWIQKYFLLSTRGDPIYMTRAECDATFGEKYIIEDVDKLIKDWENRMGAEYAIRNMPWAGYEPSVAVNYESTDKINDLYDHLLASYKIGLRQTTHQFQHEILKAEIRGNISSDATISYFEYSKGGKVSERKLSIVNDLKILEESRFRWRFNLPTYDYHQMSQLAAILDDSEDESKDESEEPKTRTRRKWSVMS